MYFKFFMASQCIPWITDSNGSVTKQVRFCFTVFNVVAYTKLFASSNNCSSFSSLRFNTFGLLSIDRLNEIFNLKCVFISNIRNSIVRGIIVMLTGA